MIEKCTPEKLILEVIVDRLLDQHPLPWKVDQDWLPEVVAKDGTMIAVSIPTPGLAQEIVQYAELRHAQRQKERSSSFEETDRLLDKLSKGITM